MSLIFPNFGQGPFPKIAGKSLVGTSVVTLIDTLGAIKNALRKSNILKIVLHQRVPSRKIFI